MSALEKGSVEQRTEFLFKVYDVDGDGAISRDEFFTFFVSSLQCEPDDYVNEVADRTVHVVLFIDLSVGLEILCRTSICRN